MLKHMFGMQPGDAETYKYNFRDKNNPQFMKMMRFDKDVSGYFISYSMKCLIFEQLYIYEFPS